MPSAEATRSGEKPIISHAQATPVSARARRNFLSIRTIHPMVSGTGGRVDRAYPLIPWHCVPNAHGGISRARDELGAVRAEGDGVHIIGVAAQLGDPLVRFQVPQADRIVLATDRQASPIGAEGRGVNCGSVVKRGEFAKGPGLRDSHGVIRCNPCDQTAVVVVYDPGFSPGGPGQLAGTLARSQVP